jgi:hypothetical protein
MNLSHIEHLGIAVKSLDEAIPFWENMLGLKCYNIEEVKEQLFEKPITPEKQAIFEGKGENNVSLKFNDVDSAIHKNGKEELIEAPKTIERLEEISTLRNIQRKIEEEEEEEKLKISNEDVSLDSLDVQIINPIPQEIKLDTDLLFDDIEILA